MAYDAANVSPESLREAQPKGPGTRRISAWLGVATVVVSGAALLGWILQNPQLKTGFSRGWPMNPVGALVFLFLGLSLWASASRSQRASARFGQIMAAAALLLSLSRVLQVWFGWSQSVDLLLFPSQVAADPAGAGLRINAGMAFILGLLALSLVLLHRAGTLPRLIARSLGVFISVLGGLAVLGYISRRGTLGPGQVTVPASFNGIECILFLSVGLWLLGGSVEANRAPEPTDTLRRRVAIGFGVALTILVLAASLSIWGSVRSAEAGRERKTGYLWRTQLTNLLSAVRDAEAGQRGYLLTGEESQLAGYRSGRDSAAVWLAGAMLLADSNAAQTQRLGILKGLIVRRDAELERTIALRRDNRADSALRIVRVGAGIRLMDSISSEVRTLLAAQEQRVAVWDTRLEFDNRVSLSANVVAGLLAVTFLTLAGLAINGDLRKRSRAETAVRESERRLAQIIELIPNMVFLKEPKDLRFVHFNKAGEELLGFSREVLIGKNDFDFFPEDEARKFVEKDREVLAQRGVVDIPEETVHTKDRGIRILHTRKVAVFDEYDRPLYLLGISQDVTDRRNAEVAIRDAKEAAELANRAKSGFLAKMSHELRTPLNSIIGFSEILEEQSIGPLNDKQHRYVGNVLTSGRNLLQLINDILDLSKVEAGRMELSVSEFDVTAALNEVINVVAALAGKKQQTVSLKVETGLPPLHADRAKFLQIMYNLVGNAIKFTPDGGSISIGARLAWREQDDGELEWLEVSVTDTGIGIAADDLKRIFGEFVQVGRQSANPEGGTGLGLALSKKLLELHRGSIDVESTPGTGSSFRFRLPTRQDALGHVHDPATPTKGFGPLALVIDDEKNARDLLVHYLSEAGYRVATAPGGKEAIHTALDIGPDVITLDILMPERDGFVTLAELKSTPGTSAIPVVVVSVSDKRELGFSLGAADWLVKPVQRADLLLALERTLDAGGSDAGKGILVVDDDPAAIEYLKQVLEENDYPTLTAQGGIAGVQSAIKHRPGLIILDLMMPDMNGFDVVRKLRSIPDTAEIPILILTAKDLTADDREQLRQSVQAIVPKGGREALLSELARISRRPVGKS